jgi:hypothetical protein
VTSLLLSLRCGPLCNRATNRRVSHPDSLQVSRLRTLRVSRRVFQLCNLPHSPRGNRLRNLLVNLVHNHLCSPPLSLPRNRRHNHPCNPARSQV